MNKLLITLVLILLGTNTLAQFPEIIHEEILPVELNYGWLNTEKFQKLNTNVQSAILAATRDTLVISLHQMNRHDLETCVEALGQEELELIRNTVLNVKLGNTQFTDSVVLGITQLSMALCTQQHPEPEPEPEPEYPQPRVHPLTQEVPA